MKDPMAANLPEDYAASTPEPAGPRYYAGPYYLNRHMLRTLNAIRRVLGPKATRLDLWERYRASQQSRGY